MHAIHNGIDTDRFHPTGERDALPRYGIDPDRPIVLFVGRVSRQKGVLSLLRAGHLLDPRAQLVMGAGAADTPELAEEGASALTDLRASRPGVHWITGLRDPLVLRQFFAAASVFVCPSVYEPMGIVNLGVLRRLPLRGPHDRLPQPVLRRGRRLTRSPDTAVGCPRPGPRHHRWQPARCRDETGHRPPAPAPGRRHHGWRPVARRGEVRAIVIRPSRRRSRSA
ncbi:glycosyltransferase [Catenuloplanes nepalensis]|uniref:glycosyltransferase n=1 Tax=Catenuloplanes nepalensis TaxID=587533 RepID=UPI0027D88DFB|nr:glycosyltransferase [Catenuloplanes nepalensis]